MIGNLLSESVLVAALLAILALVPIEALMCAADCVAFRLKS